MTQSRKISLAETVTSTAIGYVVAVAAQAAIFPLFGIEASARDHFAIAAFFTVVSIVRGYCVRRLFNRLSENDPAIWSFRKADPTGKDCLPVHPTGQKVAAALRAEADKLDAGEPSEFVELIMNCPYDGLKCIDTPDDVNIMKYDDCGQWMDCVDDVAWGVFVTVEKARIVQREECPIGCAETRYNYALADPRNPPDVEIDYECYCDDCLDAQDDGTFDERCEAHAARTRGGEND